MEAMVDYSLKGKSNEHADLKPLHQSQLRYLSSGVISLFAASTRFQQAARVNCAGIGSVLGS